MTAFVGVVNHPYFATSGVGGTFTIANVPAGTHTIQAWHELFGIVTQTVKVSEGSTTTVEFTKQQEVRRIGVTLFKNQVSPLLLSPVCISVFFRCFRAYKVRGDPSA